MDILSQEELDALFDVVKEPEETIDKPSSPPPSPPKTQSAKTLSKEDIITWSLTQRRSRSSNIISYEEAKSLEKKTTTVQVSDKKPMGSQSSRVEIKKRLLKNIPFLMLLAEHGGGILKREKELEVKTKDKKNIKGYFEKFFFDEKDFNGGITVIVDNSKVSINVADIAINEKGEFLIKTG